MLPKPDKAKKKDKGSPVGEQLDLLQPLNNEEKTKKNRFWVALLLLVTILPSLSFWLYRSLQTRPVFSTLSLPFSFPNVNVNLPAESVRLDSVLAPILKQDSVNWSIFVLTLPQSSSSFRWGQNTDSLFAENDINTIISRLQQSPLAESSLLLDRLPKGTGIREFTAEGSGFYQLNSLITVPNKQILLLFRVSASSDLTVSKNLIPDLAKAIYWHIMSLD